MLWVISDAGSTPAASTNSDQTTYQPGASIRACIPRQVGRTVGFAVGFSQSTSRLGCASLFHLFDTARDVTYQNSLAAEQSNPEAGYAHGYTLNRWWMLDGSDSRGLPSSTMQPRRIT